MHTRFPSPVLVTVALFGLGAALAPLSASAQASCPCYAAANTITSHCTGLPPVLEQGQVTPGEPFRIYIEEPSYYWRYACPVDPAVRGSEAEGNFFEVVIAKDLTANPTANSCHMYLDSDLDGGEHLHEAGLDALTANTCWEVMRDAAGTMGATALNPEP